MAQRLSAAISRVASRGFSRWRWAHWLNSLCFEFVRGYSAGRPALFSQAGTGSTNERLEPLIVLIIDHDELERLQALEGRRNWT